MGPSIRKGLIFTATWLPLFMLAGIMMIMISSIVHIALHPERLIHLLSSLVDAVPNYFNFAMDRMSQAAYEDVVRRLGWHSSSEGSALSEPYNGMGMAGPAFALTALLFAVGCLQ